MTVIYRPHKGDLGESMELAMPFLTIWGMKKYISKNWCRLVKNYIKPKDIVLCPQNINDDRIGWKNIYHVCTKRFGNLDCKIYYGGPQCIGYCSFDFEKTRRIKRGQ